LFLAAFGVVSKGLIIQQNNPAASVFQLAAGIWGYKIFGVVMWCAAITSVVGSAYTSFTFLSVFDKNKVLENPLPRKIIITAFILISAIIFISIGKPVQVLVTVGLLNGFILPLSLGVMLIAAYQFRKTKGYKHPTWLFVFGILVVFATLWLSINI
jgi:Mn2+/Fe2+ NRAMP family transporter